MQIRPAPKKNNLFLDWLGIVVATRDWRSRQKCWASHRKWDSLCPAGALPAVALMEMAGNALRMVGLLDDIIRCGQVVCFMECNHCKMLKLVSQIRWQRILHGWDVPCIYTVSTSLYLARSLFHLVVNMFFAVIETRRSTCGSQDVQTESLIPVFLKKKETTRNTWNTWSRDRSLRPTKASFLEPYCRPTPSDPRALRWCGIAEEFGRFHGVETW